MKTRTVTTENIDLTFKEWAKLPENKQQYPHSVEFDEQSIGVDEICRLKDGRIYLSSFQNGIVYYDKDQYYLLYHMARYPLGQLKSVTYLAEDLA